MSWPNPLVQLEEFKLELEGRAPVKVVPVFKEGSKSALIHKVERQQIWMSEPSWIDQYHQWKFLYAKGDDKKKNSMLQARHRFLRGYIDKDTNEVVVFSIEELATYMGVEIPQ
jgi:hypothetical protein